MSQNDWIRVSRRRPCPVCEKPDWCQYKGDDDSPTAAICQRVESEKQAGEAGWLHRLHDEAWTPVRRRAVPLAKKTRPSISPAELTNMAMSATKGTPLELLDRLGSELGVSAKSLRRLSACWMKERRCWGFPMRDAWNQITGIRLRYSNGKKFSIRGGKEGLFLPGLKPDVRLVVCEGPTDCAAMLDLGFLVIGRPSCTGGTKHLMAIAMELTPTEIVIVADDDGPGRKGAERLARELLRYSAVKVITPPDGINDAREWKAAGATAADVEAVIRLARPRTLQVQVSVRGK